MKCCLFAEAAFKNDYDSDNAKAWWWLRTPYDAYRVSIVEKDGRISGSYLFNEGGVRPAMWLSES